MSTFEQIKEILDQAVDLYNRPSFIDDDPICIPHRYSTLQDIEITGFWTAIFSWGQRKTIINKASELFNLMGKSPYDFIVNHRPRDRQKFAHFAHRTFQYLDTLYFLAFLQHYYRHNESLQDLFVPVGGTLKEGLINFHDIFFSLADAPQRTRKHIATPARKSTCKRLNMFLRWMVRNDDKGVDFGIWHHITPAQLFIPFDVHVERIARKLNLIDRKQRDWQTVEELTNVLRSFDDKDPCKYDFALFGLGVLEVKDLKL